MAVQFILGRSGTGKTTLCVRAIVDALLEGSEQPLLFLVPEQATYQAERAILSDPRVRGYHRLRILSFDRLQFLVLGASAARPAISRIGRQMLIHKVLRDARDELRIFGPSALLGGLAQQMAGVVCELHRYAVLPEDVEGLVSRLEQGAGSHLAALKFADIGLIFRRYCEALEGKFIDPEAQVGAACRAIARMDFVRGARLWVDGFAGFTGGEQAILGALLKAVDHACVAFCVDPTRLGAVTSPEGVPPPEGLFEPTERAYLDLLQWAADARVRLAKPIILKQVRRFEACPALQHVEKNIFCAGAPQSKAVDGVRLISAANLRGEIQCVARQILSLVRDRGCRYRDIAVVASDLNRYEQYVRAYFQDYGIPFFIDKRKPLNQHPVVELVCTALEAVTGGFAHADIFAYLKTDLVAVERWQIDVLENYCLAFGVDGRDWLDTERWQFKAQDDEDFDEEAINRIRDRAIQPLRELRSALQLDGDAPRTLAAGAFTRSVFALLEGLHVREALRAWIKQAREQADLASADEHRQVFDRLVDIFDELGVVFAGEEMAAQDYYSIVRSAFSQATLAFIPPGLDQVLVGSIERSRHPSLKAVFLLGATQKQFPMPVPPTGVLTDEDRIAAEAGACHLAPPIAQSLADRQYLAYIAFTRPSDFLCISYPCVDEKGGPVARSHFIDDLQLLFEDLHEEFVTDELPEVSDVRTGSELTELLCCRLGRDAGLSAGRNNNRFVELLDAMEPDGPHGATVRRVVAALRYDNCAALEASVINDLFARELRGSATRLSAFATCPYRHFARYLLELKRRREFTLEPLDLGLFYHGVLDSLQKRLLAEGESFASVEEDRLVPLVHEQIMQYAQHDPFISQFMRRSAHNAFVIHDAGQTLEECALAIAQMVRAGSFRPCLSELAFGSVPDAAEQLGRFELPLPGGRVLRLAGRIDRLDVAEIDGRKAALIFDYKRTQHGARFDWSRFYHGLDVQLAVYMLAVRDAGTACADEVAGALYMPIETVAERSTPAEFASGTRPFQRKARGILNGAFCPHLDPNASQYSAFYNFCVTKDGQPYGRYATSNALKPEHFNSLLDWARRNILRLATDIVSGRIEARPYHKGSERGCTFCEYLPVCRFDWQINEYDFLPSVGKGDLMERLDNA